MLFSASLLTSALATMAAMPSLVAAQRLPTGLQKVEPFPVSAYCAQFKNVKQATGNQFQSGEGCVSTPQGLIPDVNQMDGSTVDVSKGFRIEFNIEGLVSLTVQRLTGNRAPDARDFDFFKAFEAPSRDGNFRANLGPNDIKQNGEYRICTLAASASHQPVVMPVAQRGAQDDCVRVTFTGVGGSPATPPTPSGPTPPVPATSAPAPPATGTSAPVPPVPIPGGTPIGLPGKPTPGDVIAKCKLPTLTSGRGLDGRREVSFQIVGRGGTAQNGNILIDRICNEAQQNRDCGALCDKGRAAFNSVRTGRRGSEARATAQAAAFNKVVSGV
ncbi:hypothetical protein BC831DRAFT_554817 [Entophlyctis helioformis]|nr:hypothetical protein BC831DRAFT_554817 [Entophlyctis helioformis]